MTKKYWDFPNGEPAPNNYLWDGTGWTRNKTVKYSKCQKCFDLLPLNKLFSYVDGNNRAITKNSPELCLGCYKENYGGC